MKNILLIALLLTFLSCQKIEETIAKTTETAKEKTENILKEKISNSVHALVNAENTQFNEVFPSNDSLQISGFKGKKINLPNGKKVYVFKYSTDKNLLFPFLEKQETVDEGNSDKSVKKIDGKSIISKISFIEKFIPENIINTGFLDTIKNDESIEFYKLKRFPNSSTIIYNPKNQQVFQFVEVDK